MIRQSQDFYNPMCGEAESLKRLTARTSHEKRDPKTCRLPRPDTIAICPNRGNRSQLPGEAVAIASNMVGALHTGVGGRTAATSPAHQVRRNCSCSCSCSRRTTGKRNRRGRPMIKSRHTRIHKTNKRSSGRESRTVHGQENELPLPKKETVCVLCFHNVWHLLASLCI